MPKGKSVNQSQRVFDVARYVFTQRPAAGVNLTLIFAQIRVKKMFPNDVREISMYYKVTITFLQARARLIQITN